MKIRSFKKQVRNELNNIEINEASSEVKQKANAIAQDAKCDNPKISFARKHAMVLMLSSIAIFLLVFASIMFFSSTPSNNIFLSDNVARPVGSKNNLKKLFRLVDNNDLSFISFGGLMYKSDSLVYESAPSMDENNAMPYGSGTSQTISQVEGIQEGEIIKCDDSHIYYIHCNQLQIYEVSDGKATLLKTVTLNNCLYEQYLEQRNERYCFTETQMYVTDDNVVVLYEEVQLRNDIYFARRYYSDGYFDYYINTFNTVIEVYDKENFDLVKKATVPGRLNDGRLYNNYIYFVTTESIVDYEIADIIEKNNGIVTINTFDYDDVIYVPSYVNRPYENYICSINLETLESNYECQLGERTYATIYMSENALYLCNDAYEENSGNPYEVIYKYKIDEKGFLKYEACGSVEGGILNQYSLDEYNGYLRVVTSGRFYTNRLERYESNIINAVYVLKQVVKNGGNVLEVVSKLDQGIGYPGEQVKSVKFNKEYVSIVTYKNTDPLYLIKFTNDTEIEIVDYLKVPGYSTFLLDVNINGDTYKIGVGYTDSRDYKVSLYKEENETTVQVGKDFIVEAYEGSQIYTNDDISVETYGYNDVEIINNIRAMFLYQDMDNNTFIGFNVDKYQYSYEYSNYNYNIHNYQSHKQGTYLLLKVDLDNSDALVEFERFNTNSYYSRMVFINGYYYLVSLDQAIGYKYNNINNCFDVIE